MKIPMEVEFVDGTTEEVTPSPFAIIGWEKWSGRKMTDLASDSGGMGMGDMVRMCWEQFKLSGRTSDDYETWAASLADINPKGDPVDPTSSGAESSDEP